MRHELIYPAEKYDEYALDKNIIRELIEQHRIEADRMHRNMDYYMGKHDISSKERDASMPNAKPVCNHARAIADTCTGYFMGNPITYSNTADGDISRLLEEFDHAETDECDSDLALAMSIYGEAYEYVFVRQNEAVLETKLLSPEHAFIVHDDTIEQNELFGVYYWLKRNDVEHTACWVATVCTEHLIYEMYIDYSKGHHYDDVEEIPREHAFGEIPINHYRNNRYCIGDFEQQIGLIDAYNTLMADRVNDKEQFIDAILVVYGSILGDVSDFEDKNGKPQVKQEDDPIERLRKKKLLELPDDAKAEYLTRTFDENGMETLRKAIKEDIYNFSNAPNLTDESFAGNASGVAMEYKLLGLEMITKTKEKYFTKGLHKRIRMFCRYLNLKQLTFDANSIIPEFSRALPKNQMELSQMVMNLQGIVSKRTLLQQLPFVDDPDNEVETVQQENADNLKVQQAIFGSFSRNEPPEDEEGIDE